MTFKIAWRGASGQTAQTKTVNHKTFSGFVSAINKTIDAHKKNKNLKNKHNAAWFLRGPAKKRSNADMQYGELLIADIDDTKISPEACSCLLKELNITYFIYTTSSHSKDKPRYRIVVPYKSESDAGCKRATKYLQTKVKGIDFARESYTWSQEWYLPINGAEKFGHIGDEFVVSDDFEMDISEETESISTPLERECTHLEALVDTNIKELHPHIIGGATYLIKSGLPRDAVKTILEGLVLPDTKGRGIDPENRAKEISDAVNSAALKKNEDEDDVEIFPVDEKQPIKMELDWPPGLMGDLAKSVYDFQRYQDKTIAIMTAFALVAGIAGRRHNINDMGLAIYITLLADTGRGKDSIAKFITRTLSTCNPNNYLKFLGYKSFTGPKALMCMLAENPCRISVITEAGFAIRMKSGEQEGLRAAVLDVYTKTGRYDVAVGSGYSDINKSIPSVRAANFTMINEATPKLFIEAMMEKEGATAGDYGRMFVYRIVGEKPYENFNQRYELSKKLEARIHELMKFQLSKQTQEDPEPEVISMPPDYQEFSMYCTDMENKFKSSDQMKSALYSRANEKRLRLIGLMCALEGVKKPTGKIIEWATMEAKVQAHCLSSYSDGIGDSLMDKAMSTVGVCIMRSLVPHKKKSATLDKLNQIGIVVQGQLWERCRKDPVLKAMDDSPIRNKPISGYEKMIGVLRGEKLIFELDKEQLKRRGSKAERGFQITSEFSLRMKGFAK